MKKNFSLLMAVVCLAQTLIAQKVYTITADTVKLTNCNDSTELVIRNHTQGVSGFLYNAGGGRTIFKRGLQKLNDSQYIIGADTLKVSQNYWKQGGNAFGTTGVFGTLDSNHVDFYTNNTRRGRWMANGHLLVGTTTDNGFTTQVTGTSSVSDQLKVGTFIPGSSVSSSGATIITQGQVRASGGYNLRDPQFSDNPFNGMKLSSGGGTAIWNGTAEVLTIKRGGANTSGSVILIQDGLQAATGSGIVNILDFAANIQMLSGSNSVTYNYINLAPDIRQNTFGTGITRGLYINPSLVSAADWRSIETVIGDNRLNTSSGKTGIGINAAPTSKLDVAGDNGYSQLRMRTTYTPTSSADTNGNTGDFSWDGNYFYIKTSAGWKRSALTTF